MSMKLLYFLGINMLSFILMGWDKYCAKKHYWRISEYNLLGLALLGGAVGTLLGMVLFHHKTKKTHFKVLIPLFTLINIYFLIF